MKAVERNEAILNDMALRIETKRFRFNRVPVLGVRLLIKEGLKDESWGEITVNHMASSHLNYNHIESEGKAISIRDEQKGYIMYPDLQYEDRYNYPNSTWVVEEYGIKCHNYKILQRITISIESYSSVDMVTLTKYLASILAR